MQFFILAANIRFTCTDETGTICIEQNLNLIRLFISVFCIDLRRQLKTSNLFLKKKFTQMTSSTSTGDVQYELQNTESLLDVKGNEQISGKKREDDIYEEPARVQRNVEQKEVKQSKSNEWHLRCVMIMMAVLMIAVVILTVSRTLNDGFAERFQQKTRNLYLQFFLQNIIRMNKK